MSQPSNSRVILVAAFFLLKHFRVHDQYLLRRTFPRTESCLNTEARVEARYLRRGRAKNSTLIVLLRQDNIEGLGWT